MEFTSATAVDLSLPAAGEEASVPTAGIEASAEEASLSSATSVNPPPDVAESEQRNSAVKIPSLDQAVIHSILSTSKRLAKHLNQPVVPAAASSTVSAVAAAPVDEDTPKTAAMQTDDAASVESVATASVAGEENPDGQEAELPISQPQQQHIMTIAEEDRIRKMFSSILLVGEGLASVPGSSQFLQERYRNNPLTFFKQQLFFLHNLMKHRLLSTFSNIIDSERYGNLIDGVNCDLALENVNVIINPRGLDSRIILWKGGAICSRLETFNKECLISRYEWSAMRSTAMRLKCPFRY